MALFRAVFLLLIGAAFANRSQLMKSLLENYDKYDLPSKNTTVHLGFGIQHMDMNERLHFLEMHLWAKMRWNDPRFKWNNSLYPSKPLIIPRDKAWHPDLTLYNNADAGNFNHFEDAPLYVKEDGTVIWVPPTSVAAKCVIDTTYWPHDVHNCTAKFGSWVYDAEVVHLQQEQKPFDMSYFYDEKTKMLKYSEWKLLDIQVSRIVKYYECCPDPYVNLDLNVQLERVSPAYRWLVQIPAVGLSLLTVVVFIFPPTSGEKIVLGGLSLIANLIFLCSASHLIGHSPMHIPLILKLIVNQFILTLTSLIVCAHVLRITKDPHVAGLPSFIRRPVISFSSFLCLSSYLQLATNSAKRDDAEAEGGRSLVEGGEKGKEWLLLAAFIDRVFLVIYAAIFLIHMFYYCGVL